jgi:HSP20 family protein
MTLIHTNPNRLFWTTPSIFDGIFDDVLWDSPVKQKRSERIKVEEHDDKTEISIAAPGIKKEEFDISIKESTLTVSYEKSSDDNPRIFSRQAFARSWSLPKGTKTKDISAKYSAGILTIAVGKAAKVQPKTHSIKIA